MKTIFFKNNWLTTAALLLTLPSACFILIGILSEFGINGPIETIQPYAEGWGVKEQPGFNVTSLILFGPVIAILLTVFQFLKIEWHFTKEEFLLHLSILKRWFPLFVAAFSTGLLVVLFFYLIGENCNC